MFKYTDVPYKLRMLYSYRHPDLVSAAAAASVSLSPLTEHEAAGLVERRRFARPIPVSAAIESFDAEAWSSWDRAVDAQSLPLTLVSMKWTPESGQT